MTDQPAIPPIPIPKEMLPRTRWEKTWLSPTIPIIIALTAFFISVGVLTKQTQNTQAIAQTSQHIANEAQIRSEQNESTNTKLQNGLCNLLVSIGDVPAVPQTNAGKENVRKFRTSAVIFECQNRNYRIPDSALVTNP